jgi:hypothetical protein
MAILPTDAEIRRAILDIVAARNLRSGEIIDYIQMQRDLSQQFRAEEFSNTIKGMIADGLFTHDGGKFLKLTDVGFALV